MSTAGAKEIMVPDRGGITPVCSANKVIKLFSKDFMVFAAAKSTPTVRANGSDAVFSSKSQRNSQHTTTFTPVIKQVITILQQ